MSLHFIHITDTHLGRDPDYALKGVVTLPRVKALVDAIESLPFTPAFVVHTGDIATGVPSEEHYRLAAPIFAGLSTPVYYLPGNHDDPGAVERYLPMGPRTALEDGRSSYRFAADGYEFIAMDAKDPTGDEDSRGNLTDLQLDRLRELLEGESDAVVFIHFPPLRLGSPWLDDVMILRDGERFHRVLTDARVRIRGVFFGHVHRSLELTRDGILYVAGASPCLQFPGLPCEEAEEFQPEAGIPFNLVSLDDDTTIVKQYRA